MFVVCKCSLLQKLHSIPNNTDATLQHSPHSPHPPPPHTHTTRPHKTQCQLTARGAFTHDIQLQRRPGHDLVTRGVYSLARHPGYLGWLVWAPATQLLLGNPVCTVAFAYVVSE